MRTRRGSGRRRTFALLVAACGASLASAPAAAAAEAPFLADQLVVRFAPAAGAEDRRQARAGVGARVAGTLPAAPRVQLLDLGPGESVRGAQAALERDPDVLYAEPNFRLQPDAPLPNDPRLGEQWHLGRTETLRTWDFTSGSRDVVAAVIDSGVAVRHPDLRDNLWRNPGESGAGRESDGVDDDANGYVDDWQGWSFVYGPDGGGDSNDPTDFNGHGTVVAGVLGATGGNGLGGSGVNQRVRMLPLAVYDKGSYGVAEAIAYADRQGVRIANGSFGIRYSQAIEDALAAHPGVLLVVSAGNEAWDVEEHRPVRYPCASPKPNVICVAATDRGDHLAGFSSWGAESVDLAAPGVDLLTTGLPRYHLVHDDFETELGDRWRTGGPGRRWGRTTEYPTEFPGVYSGGAAEDSPGVPYEPGSDAWFAPAETFDLTGHEGCGLFYYVTSDLRAGDRLVVEMRSGSEPWTPLAEHTGAGTFKYQRLALTAFEGRPEVQLRFRLSSDGAEEGAGVQIDYLRFFCRRPPFRGDEYPYSGGTSLAAPQVTGTAALILSREPELTTAQLRARLLDHVDPLPALKGRTVTGGRLNTLRSVYGGRPPDPPAEPPAPQDPGPSAGDGSGPPAPTTAGPAPRAPAAPGAAPAPPPRPARDRRAPACSLTAPAGRGGLALTVRCDEAGRVTAVARRRGTTVGRASLSFARAGRRTVSLRAARRLPRTRARAFRATVVLTATDAAGNRATVRRRVTLRR